MKKMMLVVLFLLVGCFSVAVAAPAYSGMISFATILVIAALVASELVTILAPVVVFLVTQLVKKIIPGVSGWIILVLVVPLLSLAVAWVASLVATGTTFWEQFGFGLLAVFVNELFKQLKPAGVAKK